VLLVIQAFRVVKVTKVLVVIQALKELKVM
jgi:hypothetical protein